MLLLVRQLVDTRSVPGVVEVLRLRGRVHGAKFLGKRASPPRAGTTGNISHAQSIRRYLLPTWAVLSFLLDGAISVLHIYCRGSALISSFVIIVVFARDCFPYIWVIRRRRAISLLVGLLAPPMWHRFRFRRPKGRPAKRSPEY